MSVVHRHHGLEFARALDCPWCAYEEAEARRRKAEARIAHLERMVQHKETETLDKLYLEWAQFTRARTYREVIFERTLRECLASDRITEWTRERLQTALDAARGEE